MVLVSKQIFTQSQLAHLTLSAALRSIDGEFYICNACKIAMKNNTIPSCNEKKFNFIIENLHDSF